MYSPANNFALDDFIKSIFEKIKLWSPKKKNVIQLNNEKVNETTTLPAYPNCDLEIWLRSCELEIITPIEGITSGSIPSWINGSLYRNGPGKQRYDNQYVKHLFDAAGLLHRLVYCYLFIKINLYNLYDF